MTKRCSKCGEEKAGERFYSDRSRADGLSRRCKECTLVERAAYREKNREALRLRARGDRRRVPERGCWQIMIDRCHDQKNENYHLYGGRGIAVCRRWRESFAAFLRDMGPRPSMAHSIDRFPNGDGNYEPGNVRWATTKQQARNQRTNRLLTAFGRTQCVAAWAEELGLPAQAVYDRINKLRWSTERALSTPLRRQRAA